MAELSLTGLLLFISLVTMTIVTCYKIRRRARTVPALADLVPYALAVETGVAAFLVGGTFVIFQYNEMLWHFFGLAIAIHRLAAERVAATSTAPTQVPLRNAANFGVIS